MSSLPSFAHRYSAVSPLRLRRVDRGALLHHLAARALRPALRELEQRTLSCLLGHSASARARAQRTDGQQREQMQRSELQACSNSSSESSEKHASSRRCITQIVISGPLALGEAQIIVATLHAQSRRPLLRCKAPEAKQLTFGRLYEVITNKLLARGGMLAGFDR